MTHDARAGKDHAFGRPASVNVREAQRRHATQRTFRHCCARDRTDAHGSSFGTAEVAWRKRRPMRDSSGTRWTRADENLRQMIDPLHLPLKGTLKGGGRRAKRVGWGAMPRN